MAAKKRKSKTRVEDKHWGCVRRASAADLPELLHEAKARLAAAEDRRRKAEFIAASMGGIDAASIQKLRFESGAVAGERRYVESLQSAIAAAQASGELPPPLTPEQAARLRALALRLRGPRTK